MSDDAEDRVNEIGTAVVESCEEAFEECTEQSVEKMLKDVFTTYMNEWPPNEIVTVITQEEAGYGTYNRGIVIGVDQGMRVPVDVIITIQLKDAV
jgi:hypothetical protein